MSVWVQNISKRYERNVIKFPKVKATKIYFSGDPNYDMDPEILNNSLFPIAIPIYDEE